ncbi:MAG: hypothetical protein OXT64_09505 [Gammaproteobacteria bacterium]|nr:hypothetical protein [Gammaproteobacteria bacterium]
MSLPPWLLAPSRRFERMVTGGRTPHAVLVHGPGGWGEEMLASRCAMTLLGLDGESEARALAHPDLRWVEPDGQTVRIDQVRDIGEFMHQTARRGAAKVAVLNRADRMTVNAANALLKTLEEPSSGGFLILVTDAPDRLPATVRSRCQRIPVFAADQTDVLAWLAGEGLDPDRASAHVTELGGAPYRVLEAMQRGEEPIRDVLHAVASGEQACLVAAENWRDEDLVDLASRWVRIVHGMARDAEDPRVLLDFADDLTALRMVALTNSGLGRQVQLERLLLAWASLPAPTGR